ncbi:hypothetical protein VTK73DRAFT_3563 [Phialemonium thermophilum]|uniref:Uncharacterized protein n=1 Tax=Phialemonium thermophilum TaxID=223376 RepID=A0ABR3VHB8_9PEZI
MARMTSTAGRMMGLWKGLSLLRRTARGSWPRNWRTWATRVLMRSTLPESTIWFLLLICRLCRSPSVAAAAGGGADAVADEVLDGRDQVGQALGLGHDGHHAVLAAVLLDGTPRGLGHGLGAATHHEQAVLEVEVAGGHQGGELAQGVAQHEVGAADARVAARREAELALEDAQDQDRGGHDGGLGVGRGGQHAARPLLDHRGQLATHDVVDLLDDLGGGLGEGLEPRGEHADALDTLA